MIDITCLSINMLSTWTCWSLKTRKKHLQCGSKVSKRNGACQRSGKRVLFFVIVFPFWAKYASFLTRKSHHLGAIFVVEMFESAVAWETDATLIDPVSRSAWNARCLNGQWHCKSDARISWGRGWFKIRARPWGYLACTHPCWGVLLSSQSDTSLSPKKHRFLDFQMQKSPGMSRRFAKQWSAKYHDLMTQPYDVDHRGSHLHLPWQKLDDDETYEF